MPPRQRACDDCPFWPDRIMRRSLGEPRVDGIKEHIEGGGYFPCHKTTARRHALEHEYDGWENAPALEKIEAVAKEQQCVGARIWAEHGRELGDGD